MLACSTTSRAILGAFGRARTWSKTICSISLGREFYAGQRLVNVLCAELDRIEILIGGKLADKRRA